jgi:hypothetical protein
MLSGKSPTFRPYDHPLALIICILFPIGSWNAKYPNSLPKQVDRNGENCG